MATTGNKQAAIWLFLGRLRDERPGRYKAAHVAALFDCPHDGLDGSALPVPASPAHAPRTALHRDGDGGCDPARQSRAVAGLRPPRRPGGPAARRVGAGKTGRGREDRRGIRLQRNQSQCRLPVGSRAVGPLRRLPDARAGACRRVRSGDARVGFDSGDRQMPHRRGRSGPRTGVARCDRVVRARGREDICRSRPQGVARRAVAEREPRCAAARLRSRLPREARAFQAEDRHQWRGSAHSTRRNRIWTTSTA